MNTRVSEDAVIQLKKAPSEWAAFLRLKFAKTARGVRLVEKEHHGPLYIQKPFYPEGLATPHAYLLHPPGGLVSGDHLQIQVQVEANAHALITTPGAGRMYRARSDGTPQTQTVVLDVADGANIEWLPLEAIAFPSANAVANNTIYLQADSKVIFWDVLCLGLPANKQSFDSGTFNQNLRIFRSGRLDLQERLVLNDSNRSLLENKIAFQGNPVQGLLVAGPFLRPQVELIEQLRNIAGHGGNAIGITQVADFIIVRNLGHCSEQVRKSLQKIWACLRPALLGKEACAPRIWNT